MARGRRSAGGKGGTPVAPGGPPDALRATQPGDAHAPEGSLCGNVSGEPPVDAVPQLGAFAHPEEPLAGQKLRVRSLGGDGVKGKSPAEVRKALETQSTGWGKLFGEPALFYRLKDR